MFIDKKTSIINNQCCPNGPADSMQIAIKLPTDFFEEFD
jgi:hypothetical protein